MILGKAIIFKIINLSIYLKVALKKKIEIVNKLIKKFKIKITLLFNKIMKKYKLKI